MATATAVARKTTRRVAIADRGSRSSCVSVNFHAIEQTRRRVDGMESKAIDPWTARRRAQMRLSLCDAGPRIWVATLRHGPPRRRHRL